MTEVEKMLAGELYDYSDPEALELNLQAHERLEKLNTARYRDTQGYRAALRELIPGFPDSSYLITPFHCDFGFRTTVGEGVVINFNCTFLDGGGITIGNHTLIGPNCQLYTPHHPTDYLERRKPIETGKAIRIGDDCWLGGGVIVCPGVTIGNRCIIAAGSVVTRDIPDDSLAAGNPAVVKRKLNAMTNTEKLHTCAEALRRHHFETAVVANTQEAFEKMKSVVEAESPKLVSFGDSMTMRETGIIEWLRNDERFTLLDGFDASMPRPERLEIRRQALMSDLFITGVNALTTAGTLHWLDMVGNRIAPVAFGPRKVILVAGRNKIVDSRDEAEERIRRIAAPQNIARHPGFRTPCAKTGVCMDCNAPDRICNTRMEMLRCHPAGRILVILIDQDLGL
ncbi:MAG TPA: LUD domain-containing protein [Candidatus Alistipes intestinigallinarum]|uniref:Nodulation protein L n=1 Tax=Candidatus Alistipes intestinigallinarum TaxID=2838440 RepID=A0A9D2CD35_9BACT|nr:LUD domain-containing protein [Candidatus Alistipes intestinigallinarum]